MIFKILKEYIRRISRNYKIYTISILGMSIAIIASFHIYHFVFKELSVDGFHTKKKEIYRLVNKAPNSNSRYTSTFFPLGEVLKEKIPEVEDFIRIINQETPYDLHIKDESQKINLSFVDPSFFELFNFSLKEGDVSKFKETPNSIVISEKISKQLFKDKNPIGELITVSKFGETKKWTLQVTGIINKIPDESTIQGDYFVNTASIEIASKDYKKYAWNFLFVELYIYAPNITDINEFSETIKDVMIAEANLSRGNYPMKKEHLNFDFQPLNTVYFDSLDISNQKKKGDLQFLKIIILVGLLTLFLAISNYILMNLGLNMNRAKEFKARRYLGASKGNIYNQLVVESLINAFICFAITLLTYPILGEFISNLIGFEYQFSFANDLFLLTTFLLIILFIGFITGTLEYILSYKTIFDSKTNRGNSWASKKVMICFQLFLFISLMTCILFVRKQINYMYNKDIGFDTKNIISLYPNKIREEIKNELLSKSYVVRIAGGEQLFRNEYNLEEVSVLDKDVKVEGMIVIGDADYLSVYNIELLYGKNLNPKKLPTYENWGSGKGTRGITEVLVNEEFVRKSNVKNPIGTMLKVHGESVIVGVFKNINNTPLYNPIQPIIIGYDFSFITSNIQISFMEGYKKQVISDIKDVFRKNGLESTFSKDYNIKSIDYQDIYKKELQLKRLLEAFTVIVLFISLLGMIAISLFITESKTKEIGIRKVNGATINEIMFMLNKDFIKWVLIAFVIACPIAYYAMSKWLENFAYKTTLSWWVFALAGVFTLIIALLTVSWQTYRAATRNPVESLRDE